MGNKELNTNDFTAEELDDLITEYYNEGNEKDTKLGATAYVAFESDVALKILRHGIDPRDLPMTSNELAEHDIRTGKCLIELPLDEKKRAAEKRARFAGEINTLLSPTYITVMECFVDAAMEGIDKQIEAYEKSQEK